MKDDFATPEERLLIMLSHATLDEDERHRARILSRAIRSWDDVWNLAEINATVPLIHSNLDRLGLCEEVPEPVRVRFQARAEDVRAANEARLKVARDLFARFAERKIPVIILKGVLFAETIYRNPAYKRMNDVDILIRKEDLDAIYEIYEEMRLFSAAELVGGSPRKQEKFSHHAPPFFSRDLTCMIGTHWGLITPLAPYALDYEGIWSRARDVDFYGIPAKAMAPEDNLHHLCVHLPYYKTGVRELADIYNLIRHHNSDLDWEFFLLEVARAKTENLVYHALSLSNRLCPTFESEEAVRRLAPRVSWYFRRDTHRKTASLNRLLRSRSVHLSRIEKAYADLGTTKKAGEKWSAFGRMWRHILVPPMEDVVKMNAFAAPGPVAFLWGRLVTPWRIFRVFACDVGGWIFAAIMVKCLYDVLRQTVVAPFSRTRDHTTFAARLGVTVEDLRRLKEALE